MKERGSPWRTAAGMVLFIGPVVAFGGIGAVEAVVISNHQEQINRVVDHLPIIRELGSNPRLYLELLVANYAAFYATLLPSWKLSERLLEPPGGWINSHRKLTQ